MTSDKFGRSLKRTRRSGRGPPGIGFNLTDDGDYDIRNKRMCFVGEPKKPQDATTKVYVDSKVIPLYNDHYYFHNMKINGLKDPEHEDEAVNLRTLNTKCMTADNNVWNARNKKINNLSPPVGPTDAVNLDHINTSTITRLGDIFDAKDCRISNVAKPRDLDDVVTRRYIKQELGELSYAIYRLIHKSRASLLSRGMWHDEVMNSTWDVLFDDT